MSSSVLNVNPAVTVLTQEAGGKAFSAELPGEMGPEPIVVQDLKLDVDKEFPGQGKWPKWVKACMVRRVRSMKHYQMIHDMIMEGFPDLEIARQVRERGELVELSLGYVCNLIRAYRHTIPKVEIVNRLLPGNVIRAQAALEDGVDVLKEMTSLYRQIRSRIDMVTQRELQFGALLPGAEKQFQPAVDLLVKILEISERLGLTQGQKPGDRSRELDWDSIYSRRGMNEMMADPKSKYRIVKFVEGMTALYGNMPKERQAQILEQALREVKQEVPVAEPQEMPMEEPPRKVIVEQVMERKIVSEQALEQIPKREPG